MPSSQLCLLSLDGGGVRGLSSLQILKQLMETINPESPPKPCEYFDMIGGTSTGGSVSPNHKSPRLLLALIHAASWRSYSAGSR
jgi:patatin-like phospholipase/acyl hydrolase